MLRLVFHPALSSEVKTSYDWYADKTEGLVEPVIRKARSRLITVSEPEGCVDFTCDFLF